MNSVNIFISFAEEEKPLKEELLKHLSVLLRSGTIRQWNKNEVLPGENPDSIRMAQLQKADIVIFLVSSNLFASNDIYQNEIEAAVALQKSGKCQILPIMAKPYLITGTVLDVGEKFPKGKAVTTHTNQDDAWLEAVSGLLEMIAKIRGTSSDTMIAKYNRERNQEKIEVLEKYNLQTSAGQIEIGKRIETLKIKPPMGNYKLVNVNREASKNAWWDAYDEKINEEEYFQFYFVASCPTQMPPSFSERMIYELKIEELEDSPEAIHYETVQDTGRIAIRELPLKRNLEKSKEAFKKYFCQRFDFQDADFDFDKFVQQGVPKLNYRYVASIFKISTLKWKDFLPEFFTWIVSTFQYQNEELPIFLFFFVVYVEHAHDENLLSEKNQKVITQLNELAVANENSTLFKKLLPVHVDDLKLWFNELGEENPEKIEEVIESVVAGLDADKQNIYKNKSTLDMSTVEMLQEVVFKTINK